MDMLPLPDLHHLRAASGWLGLGNFLEANEELEKIAPQLRAHPDVLEIRWQIYAKEKKWEACEDIAAAVVKLAPEKCNGWIHRSFALHELKRTDEAFENLLPAADQFPDVWTIPYNLACYCSQLQRLEEAQTWFKKAMAIDEKTVKQAAMVDPDLNPLWDSMSRTLWKRAE
jgi:tetratricopeptide (TPR) repeat protein